MGEYMIFALLLTVLQARISEPDAEGRRTADIVVPNMPAIVMAGDWAETYEFVLPRCRIVAISSMVAVYPGDQAETLLEFFTAESKPYRLLQRSEHFVGMAPYDAWRRITVRYAIDDGGQRFALYLLARGTAGRPIGAHFGLRLELEPLR